MNIAHTKTADLSFVWGFDVIFGPINDNEYTDTTTSLEHS